MENIKGVTNSVFESELTLSQDSEELETYFRKYREEVIGDNFHFNTYYGKQKLLYADWLASGRLYAPIERIISEKIGPTIANTHSFSSETGKITTYSYKYAREIIRKHVKAGEEDILITTGTGMTAAVSKLIRLMGLRESGKKPASSERPVVFISHMEHHSNQVPWLESSAEVVILPPGEDLKLHQEQLKKELTKYKDRPLKIGAFSACSNVTGLITPYMELAEIMHRAGGYCFVDFAASAPYVDINMHAGEEAYLDAIAFSPHKFLGGPGSCGVLVMNRSLYRSSHPDNPGGGNVKWTTPSGAYAYYQDIETLEDGGTPGFLQVIRAALAIRLKEEMGLELMRKREAQLLQECTSKMEEIPGLYIMGNIQREDERIGCISFGIKEMHYNLVVRLLNDRFGIQVRGGWSCASTYSHYLFGLDQVSSSRITTGINENDLSRKPGWVRLSLHPTMSSEELQFIITALKEIVTNKMEWAKHYTYNKKTNEFDPVLWKETIKQEVERFFGL